MVLVLECRLLTRSIIAKIHSGELAKEATSKHGIFDLEVPEY